MDEQDRIQRQVLPILDKGRVDATAYDAKVGRAASMNDPAAGLWSR